LIDSATPFDVEVDFWLAVFLLALLWLDLLWPDLAFVRDRLEPFDLELEGRERLVPLELELEGRDRLVPLDLELELDPRALDFVFVCATVGFLSPMATTTATAPRVPVVRRDNQWNRRAIPMR
jgi:hypothetical protein